MAAGTVVCPLTSRTGECHGGGLHVMLGTSITLRLRPNGLHLIGGRSPLHCGQEGVGPVGLPVVRRARLASDREPYR